MKIFKKKKIILLLLTICLFCIFNIRIFSYIVIWRDAFFTCGADPCRDGQIVMREGFPLKFLTDTYEYVPNTESYFENVFSVDYVALIINILFSFIFAIIIYRLAHLLYLNPLDKKKV